MAMTSTYMYTLDSSIQHNMSLIYRTNNTGPRIGSGGTTTVKGSDGEHFPLPLVKYVFLSRLTHVFNFADSILIL